MSVKLDGKTLDLEQVNIQKLKSVFPDCVNQEDSGKYQVNIDKLLSLLGNYIDIENEKYSFTWKGKNDCLRLAQKRSCGTLRPCREESVDFDNTQNLYIEGDNLEVLKLLQRSYFGKVKMIYIDPPYNTGNDFVYKDDFKDPLDTYKHVTNQANNSNAETSGRFHTNWLNMIYPRIRLAANLLTKDGVIFISIDDNEVTNLRKICDEVFGEENFIAQFIWAAGRKNDSKFVSVSHEYMVCYVKNKYFLTENKITWRERKQGLDEIYAKEKELRKAYGDDYESMTKELKNWYKCLPEGAPAKNHAHYYNIDYKGVFFKSDISWPGGGGPKYDVLHPLTRKPVRIPSRGWITNESTMLEWIKQGRVFFGQDETYVPTLKSYLSDKEYAVPYSVFYKDGRAASKRLMQLMGSKIFENPKDEEVLKRLLDFVDTKNAYVLDFFSGSATTAHAVMQQNAEDGGNRKFIMVQLPELCDAKSEAAKAGYSNICEIGKERLRRAGRLINDKQIAVGKPVVNVGFKVFKLDSSNFVPWDESLIEEGNIDELKERLSTQVKNLKEDRTETDLLYEIILKMGFCLTDRIDPVTVNGKTVFYVDNSHTNMLVCLAQGILVDDIEQMAEMKPKKIVISEGSFFDNSTLSNAYYIFQNRGIDFNLI